MQDRWFRNKPPRICVVIGLQHYFIVKDHFRISGTGGTLPKVLNRYGWLDQLEKSCKKASVVLVLGVTEGQAILGTLLRNRYSSTAQTEIHPVSVGVLATYWRSTCSHFNFRAVA